MKNVNQLVSNVQAEGNESYSYVELFEVLSTQTIEPKAESFRKQLKGNTDEAISEGYKLMMELVHTWDGSGNFHTLFKTSYTNRLKNLIKHIGRNKRKHNTSYDISLSESVASVLSMGEASPIIETLYDASLVSTFDITEEKTKLEKLIEMFGVKYPEQADVINIMIGFNDDMVQMEKTNAYCEYFGVQSYTSAIQKRVSRSREAFKNFLTKNNYNLNF
jgi:hypothetical protein